MDEKKINDLKQSYQSIKIPDNLKERMVDQMKKAKEEKRKTFMNICLKRTGIGVAAALALITVLSNSNADIAHALSKVPVLSQVSKVVTFRTYQTENGGFDANIQVPQIEETDVNQEGQTSEAVDKLNKELEEYATSLIERYENNLKENNEVANEALDSSYEVLTNTDSLLTIRIDTVATTGGAAQFSKIYNVDKLTGEVLELNDLFTENSDYISVISENIKQQMQEQMDNDDSKIYNINTDMPESDFESIHADQNFYFDKNNDLVIVFDEYEVAPGYMGEPEFVIPADVLTGITK